MFARVLQMTFKNCCGVFIYDRPPFSPCTQFYYFSGKMITFAYHTRKENTIWKTNSLSVKSQVVRLRKEMFFFACLEFYFTLY